MKEIMQAVFASLVATSAAQAQQAVQWKVSDGGNGHWYQLEMTGRPWQDQQRFATAHGGHLATLNSPSESAWVRANLPYGSLLYFGFFQDVTDPSFSEPAGGWKWVTGEPVTWFDWCPGEPNNLDVGQGPQNVVQTNGQPGSCVDDTHGLWSFPAWIEWDADCNGDGIVDYGQILSGQLADTDLNGVPDCCDVGRPCCIADINHDGKVSGADLGQLLLNWGVSGTKAFDLNSDGVVDGGDLSIIVNAWGPCAN